MESNKSSPHNTRIPKVIWLPGEVPILNHFIFHSQHVNFMFLSMWSACVVIFVCLKYWNHLRPKCMRDSPPPSLITWHPLYYLGAIKMKETKSSQMEEVVVVVIILPTMVVILSWDVSDSTLESPSCRLIDYNLIVIFIQHIVLWIYYLFFLSIYAITLLLSSVPFIHVGPKSITMGCPNLVHKY